MEYRDVSIISIEERKRLERVEQGYKEYKAILDNCSIAYYRILHQTEDVKLAKQAILTDELLNLILS